MLQSGITNFCQKSVAFLFQAVDRLSSALYKLPSRVLSLLSRVERVLVDGMLGLKLKSRAVLGLKLLKFEGDSASSLSCVMNGLNDVLLFLLLLSSRVSEIIWLLVRNRLLRDTVPVCCGTFWGFMCNYRLLGD